MSKPEGLCTSCGTEPCVEHAYRFPARVARTGKRQLSISLNDDEAARLEAYRLRYRLRSWNEAVRMMINGTTRREEPHEE